METFAERFSILFQRYHDLSVEMHLLTAEFQDHNERMADMIYRMEVRFTKANLPSTNVVSMPLADEPMDIPAGIKPTIRR